MKGYKFGVRVGMIFLACCLSSRVGILASEVYTPPYSSAKEYHHDAEINALGVASTENDSTIDLTTGKIKQKTFAASDFAGNIGLVVIDAIYCDFSVATTGYYSVKSKGNISGKYWNISPALIGAAKGFLKLSLGSEVPQVPGSKVSSVIYATDLSDSALVGTLAWSAITGLVQIGNVVTLIDTLSSTIQEEESWDSAIDTFSMTSDVYLEAGQTYRWIFQVNSESASASLLIAGQVSAVDLVVCLEEVEIQLKDEVTFSTDTLINAGDYTYDGRDVIVDGCTLTIDGQHEFNNLQIIDNGTVKHSAAASGQPDHKIHLTILQDLTIYAGSQITADGLGYSRNSGLGAGQAARAGGGGGYGGSGGRGKYGSHGAYCGWSWYYSYGDGGITYGSIAEPVDLGSGGGRNEGGNGGGAIYIYAGGTLQLDGSITSNGGDGGSSYTLRTPRAGGGGSGGSIWLSLGTLYGSGNISANGGDGGYSVYDGLYCRNIFSRGGGGGGGRIAIYCDSNLFTGAITTNGGSHYGSAGDGTITGIEPHDIPTPTQVEVDALVSISVGRVGYERRTGQFSVNVTVTNISDTAIGSPVWLVIEICKPEVTVANSDGTTSSGKPYADLSAILGDGQLDPGESVSRRIYFNNPNRVRFTFQPSVLGMILP